MAMATIPSPWAIQPACSALALTCVDEVSDGHLLDLFIQHKDETAFAGLVRRHGRMVLGVCQRILDNRHDAEDCFQAVFLVLVRKATTIQPREMVGNWLYGVAYRTALEAKKMGARRRNRERKKFEMPRPEADADRWEELRPLLDQELSRLPSKYRFVVIACDLEGRTRKEVARALDLPEGTVASRLARGRTMLAKRLTRRHLAISAVALAAILAEKATARYVPAGLTASTMEAASLLAAGKPAAGIISANVAVLINAAAKSMLLTKLEIASAVLVLLAALGLGVGAMIPSAAAWKKPDQPQAVLPVRKDKPQQVEDCVLDAIDLDRMTIQAVKVDTAGDGGTVIYDLKVPPATQIVVDGKGGELADLKVGDCVNVLFERGADGTARALRIESVPDALGGVVEAITDSSLTIQTERGGTKKKYDLDRHAWAYVDYKKVKLANVIKMKMKVSLHISAGKPAIVGIKATGPKVDGEVKKIDADKRTLSLGAQAISVADGAIVRIDGKQAELGKLRPGMRVTLEMSAHTQPSDIVGITTGKP
jgi:RNA polymerase sigma factor (sigma-70 family)